MESRPPSKIFVSPIRTCIPHRDWRWRESAYLFTEAERWHLHDLDAFADSIGLKRSWRRSSVNGCPHYEITRSRRKDAIEKGAIELSQEESQACYRAWTKRIQRGREIRLPFLPPDPKATPLQREIAMMQAIRPRLAKEDIPPLPAVITYEMLLDLATVYDRVGRAICGVAISPATEKRLLRERHPEFTDFLIDPRHALGGIPRLVDPRLSDDEHQVFTCQQAWHDRQDEQATYTPEPTEP